MRLVKLEIRNYRSFEGRTDDAALEFSGLDCVVGKNNAGKSNLLKAIRYLLNGESADPALHFGRDETSEVDVRGFFDVEDSDFELLKLEEKREKLKSYLGSDGTLGVCRRSSNGSLEFLRFLPDDERLSQSAFEAFWTEAWSQKDSKDDFYSRMADQFPELVGLLAEGKEKNKGAWPKAYEAFVQDQPNGIEFSLQPVAPPTGLPADPANMLPRVLYVPAVKEITDATKTTKRAELGALLSELGDVIREDLDIQIKEALADVFARLNIIQDPDTGETKDERHIGVRSIEQRMSSYLAEAFEGFSVSLEFPSPTTESILDDATVWIEEGGEHRFLVPNVGEGVKRVLVFSMFRTLADLRQGDLIVDEDASAKPNAPKQPLMILYEEAELFLHPGLQAILLHALQQLVASGSQVVFTTHSPFMVRHEVLGTIGLLSKVPGRSTESVEFHSRLRDLADGEQHRLVQVQHASSYLFADQVVLVEGDSDRLVLEKLSRRLNEEWNFEQRGIPVLTVSGKGDLPLFRDFLQSLGIRPFVVTDIDAVKEPLPKLCSNPTVLEVRDSVLEAAREAVTDEPTVNKSDVRRLVDQYSWNEVFDQLEELQEALNVEGQTPHERQRAALSRLLDYRKGSAWRTVLKDPPEKVSSEVQKLSQMLLEEDILLLQGSLEDYYPAEESNKREAALAFEAGDWTLDDLSSRFGKVNGEPDSDVHLFLDAVFSASVR